LDNARDEDGQARDKDRLKYMADDSEQWPSHIVERSELQRVLLESIESMPPLERTVLSLYFYDEMTLRQIGKVVDLHESRVSQLKARGLLRLRASLTKCWPRVGEPCEQSTAA
jgi:RNA polymerase sigma factor for flagellar operon FliA